jgi:hypothetical protein
MRFERDPKDVAEHGFVIYDQHLRHVSGVGMKL